jgi:electron transport complex protein RnfC
MIQCNVKSELRRRRGKQEHKKERPLMAVSTFKYGLKLPARKHATEGMPVELVPSPKQVVIPVNQHFGAPNKPLVSIGDKVIRGQLIAAAPGPMTVPVHASISGVVKKIEPRTQANNTEGLCVIIEALLPEEISGAQEVLLPPLDPLACTREEAIARVREAGILGMGGAGFPSHIKLSPPQNKPIDLIIADCAECEPYLKIGRASCRERV